MTIHIALKRFILQVEKHKKLREFWGVEGDLSGEEYIAFNIRIVISKIYLFQ